jgi:ubiquinone/menaquinone biosynthesis C-methylase UbiE
MKNRKIIEKEFHDNLRKVNGDPHVMETRWSPELEKTVQNNPLWVNMKYYSVERKSREMILGWFQQHCLGKRVLDYCCGNGEDSRIIAKYGAKEVIGIDISEVSVENCKKLARQEGYDKIVTYLIKDAEDTDFENNSFDIITEYGALHHLDLEKAFGELARILRPDGKIICNEALRHNLFIHAYRKMTHHLRTPWEVEHIMGKKEFDLAQKYFGKIEMHFFHLFVLMAVPLRNTFIFKPLLAFLEWVDSLVLRLPGIKWWAWQAVFVLSEPQK